MKRCGGLLLAAVLAVPCTIPRAYAADMDFDDLEVGTRFGESPGEVPGTVVHTEDGIVMSLENFYLGSHEGFHYAEAGGRFAQYFPTTALDLNNISVVFDVGDVLFNVTQVTLEYQEFGGADNFAVNGSTIYELASLMDIPTQVAPNVTADVAGGVITLTGDIERFRIGGQELTIDSIVAVPEPAPFALLLLGGVVLLRRHRRTARRHAQVNR